MSKEELLKKFHQMDRSGDGRLTIDEVRDCVRRSGLPESQVTQFMALFDLDGDNVVTLDEYILALGLTPPPPNDRKSWEQAFKHMDKDGSGFLSKGEIRELLEETGFVNCTEEDIQTWMDSVDGDGDQKISYAEFAAFLETHFGQ
ncbi:unnamed protein product [Calicophoron daubneyi]|uniref:EF-hand domain-containing protein n=1 Tax=Calicophoron daubneyi TaxID=300641 RepID=A0AAV2TJX5_CALDB